MGNGGKRGTKGEQCFGMIHTCLKFGESYKLCPHLKFQTYCGLGGRTVMSDVPNVGGIDFGRAHGCLGAHGV